MPCRAIRLHYERSCGPLILCRLLPFFLDSTIIFVFRSFGVDFFHGIFHRVSNIHLVCHCDQACDCCILVFLFLSNLFFIFLFVLTWIGFVSQSFAISLPKSCSAVVIRMSCMSLHIRMHIVCLCLVLHAKLFYVYCFYIFAPGQCAHIYHRVFQCKLYAFAHFAMVKWILAHF